MAERVVNIKIQAVADGAVRGFAAVRDAAAEAKTKLEESAQNQRQAWATVGQGLTAVGVAITGVGIAALKTGIQYNTLQQTTRAALTTLLGSAEAANAQMNKLDDFARNSPFAKQTFITAQQQMLAFGIETEKVIPYLDSVQNAVAAMGGSNQQIAEISFIMSQISSASKITAQDLMQFGQRGINAAELIGSQMGKTGAQIREDITAGALDADQALDALSAGMASKFGGAADNVKNTFEGAMDRVKAAWRDFSSELARPLVDPDGGGALIDLLNWAADAMRAFQDLPEPVKNTITALTGVVGVGALLSGAAITLYPKLVAFKTALADIGGVAGLAKGGLTKLVDLVPHLMLFTAAALAMTAFTKATQNGKTEQTEFAWALSQTTDMVDALKLATLDTKSNYWTQDFKEELKDIPGLLDSVIASNQSAMHFLSLSEQKALENLKQMGVELSTLAKSDFPAVQEAILGLDLTESQLMQLFEEVPELKNAFREAATEIGLTNEEAQKLGIWGEDAATWALAFGDVSYESEKAAQSLEVVAGVATDVTDAISALAEEILNFGSAQIDADRAAIDLQDKITKLNDIFVAGEATLGIYTAAGRDTERSMLDVVEAAKKNAEAIAAAGGTQEEMTAVLEDARNKLIEQRIALGEDADAARRWADERIPSAEAVAQSLDEVKDAADSIPSNPSVTVTADTSQAMSALNSFISAAKNVVVSPMLSAVAGRASGGTIGFARGGTIPGYASGSTVGIGGGVTGGTVWGRGTSKSDSITVNLSKGEEVIQEPYASLNRPLLKAINRGDFSPSMMQPQVIVRGGGETPYVSLAGATLKASIDGRPITLMIDEQIAAATADVSGASLTSALGARVAR